VQIILASQSSHRKQLLAQLGLEFGVHPAFLDETQGPGETPRELVHRLAREKAARVGKQFDEALVIASDQVGVLEQEVLCKPGNHENATRQLEACSGKTVEFLTSLALLNTVTGRMQVAVETFKVHFRQLEPELIEAYLRREKPYDSAGSFKVESLGIALFSKLSGDDPNTLIGLPLIRLVDFLQNEGVSVLQPA
jgi:MAF protein